MATTALILAALGFLVALGFGEHVDRLSRRVADLEDRVDRLVRMVVGE